MEEKDFIKIDVDNNVYLLYNFLRSMEYYTFPKSIEIRLSSFINDLEKMLFSSISSDRDIVDFKTSLTYYLEK